MIPANQNGDIRVGGLVLRDHWFEAPLDQSKSGGEQIRLYAREVVAADKAASGDDRALPWLLFLQGGPGMKADRPSDNTGWLGRAIQEFRVLLLDQRGTGRSTPATATSLSKRGDAADQADYLAHLRADSIVADAELIRGQLAQGERWSVLGQSFGGFCALTYLSFAPEGLRSVFLSGGLAPLEATAKEVYAATFAATEMKNSRFDAAFPQAREQLEAVAAYVRTHDVSLPDGSPLTVERLQGLGIGLGLKRIQATLAYLLEEAFVDGPAGLELSDFFLAGVLDQISFATEPLYAVMHESIYGQSAEPTNWAAHQVRETLPQFSPNGKPLLFTGEMIYPWMFDADPVLQPLKETANLLALRPWKPLYDMDTLAKNNVPVAATLYVDDMYVDPVLSRRTAASIRGLRVWETNAHEHEGLLESEDVLDRLIRMTRGEL